MKKIAKNAKTMAGAVKSQFRVSFPADKPWADRPSALALSNGQFYVLDSIEDIPAKLYIGRVNSEGNFDKRFAQVGWKAQPMEMDAVYPAGLMHRADNSVIAALFSARSLGLACFTQKGVLNPAFGDNGVIVHRGARAAEPLSAASRGAIVPSTGGYFYALFYSVPNPFGTLLRCKPNGRLDHEFTIEYNGEAIAADGVVAMPDGGATVVGSVGNMFYDKRGYFARFIESGSPDASFGEKGYVVIDPKSLDFPDDLLISMHFRQVTAVNGALMASGDVTVMDSGRNVRTYGLVASVTFSGKPNTAFNGGRPVLFQEVPDAQRPSFSGGIRAQRDGKIVVGGQIEMDKGSDLLVVRYLPNGLMDETFAGTGWLRFGAKDAEDAEDAAEDTAKDATENVMRDLSLNEVGEIIVTSTSASSPGGGGRFGAVLTITS